jgi:hypothetical protein
MKWNVFASFAREKWHDGEQEKSYKALKGERANFEQKYFELILK